MKLKIYDGNAKAIGDVELPVQFNEVVRPEIIRRAVKVILSNKRQPYGASPRAGLRASAYVSKRRNHYKTMYGIGISRTPKKVMTHRGKHFNWVGAVAPNAVGGRRAHAPKGWKDRSCRINSKERKKAIRSALAATLSSDLVKTRSHIIPDTYPFVLSKDVESLSRVKDANELLVNLGLKDELNRVSKKKVRAGKGKLRSRRYKTVRGMLIVTSKYCPLTKAVRNIPGVEVKNVKLLSAEDLAPGTHVGRLTLFTQSALDEMKTSKLFLN